MRLEGKRGKCMSEGISMGGPVSCFRCQSPEVCGCRRLGEEGLSTPGHNIHVWQIGRINLEMAATFPFRAPHGL